MSTIPARGPTRAQGPARRPLPQPGGRVDLSGPVERIVLRALEQVTVGELELVLPDGSSRRFGRPGTGPQATVRVSSRDLFRRLARGPRLGLGESYAAGDWRADDLVAFFELLIRNVEAARRRNPLATLARLERRRPHVPIRRDLTQAQRDISYHYDLGNDLYGLFLDETMTYSCATFDEPGQSLADAQRSKLRRICEKLALGPDDRVLEIGCGWGSFALVAAAEYGARVTGLTISRRQHELARKRVAEAGLGDRVEILLRDYRTLRGRFTKIASIEMLEAIGHRQYPTFFAACDRLLIPGGVACIQTIAIPDQRYDSYRRHTDWIREHIFPGSLLPSLKALVDAMTRSSTLGVDGLEDIGRHYAPTLRAWRERFLARSEEVHELGYDERFVRTWEFYLAYCEAAFATRSLRDLQLVLSRPLDEHPPR